MSDANARPPMLSVTYALPPEAGSLVTWPSIAAGDGSIQSTSLTPQLQARFSDDGVVRRVEFELEHDPQASGQGTGQIWSGSVEAIQGNSPALVTIPAGSLTDGWKVRWRARAYDGAAYSAWTSWQNFTLNANADQTAVSCVDYPAGQWSTDKASVARCVITLPTAGNLPYSWGLDDPATPNTGIGKTSAEISITPDEGWRTLYVKVGSNPLAAYSFGVGAGSLVSPSAGTHAQQVLKLQAHAGPTWTGVRYEYRTDLSNGGLWTAIPLSRVSPEDGGGAISSWPQGRADAGAPFAALGWNAAATLAEASKPIGPLQVRVCFVQALNEKCGKARFVIVDDSGFAASDAVIGVGAGSVSLASGDFALSASDGAVGGLGVSRTHTSLAPYAEQGVSGVFGPGWSASFPAGAGMSNYTLEDRSTEGYVLLTGPGRVKFVYSVQSDGTYKGVAEAADGSRVIKKNATVFQHVGRDDIVTTWAKNNVGRWDVTKVTQPTEESEVNYVQDGQGRYTRLLAPPPSGIVCGSSLTSGCKALDIAYASTTTATGIGSGWGDFTGQTKQLTYIAFDPASNGMKSTVVTKYAYDLTGHLRQVTNMLDGLSTVYYYDGAGRLSQVTPPGISPWKLGYDSLGRLAHVARTTPQGESVQALAYQIPVSGNGAPVNLGLSESAKWGQTIDLPYTGTAIFPSSHVPGRDDNGSYQPTQGDWQQAKITYLNAAGHAVNTAAYGSGEWQISTTRYDEHGNQVWSLSPGNRQRALTPDWTVSAFVAAQPTSAERANLLAAVNSYNGDGDILSTLAPARETALTDGRVVAARAKSSYRYDEGKRVSGSDEFGVPYVDKRWHLVTTIQSEPSVLDGDISIPSADVRIGKSGYDAQSTGDSSGWVLRAATTETIIMGGTAADLVKQTRYDTAGRTIESHTPGSNGNDAGVVATTYYTATANTKYPECGSRPYWPRSFTSVIKSS